MRTIILIFLAPFVIRLILYFYHLVIVKRFLSENRNYQVSKGKRPNVLILIPVLREQNVIEATINHFLSMNVNNMNLYLVIAGTNREKVGNINTTLGIVETWIEKCKKEKPKNIEIDYCEAVDEGGDRATQLNYAVKYVKENKHLLHLDYIGVYDADSLPSLVTLQEVVHSFGEDGSLDACQQPVHFAKTASKMAERRENPVLVANALYQSTWTAISELPMWIKYYKRSDLTLSKRHLYLIGHGEFITEEIYNNFQFPEYAITDGIQLGYRLGMSNKRVKPLHEFCNDDVPHNIKSVIKQHKRWYGGCMNFKSSYEWAKKKYGTNAWLQFIDGVWSQIRWAWAATFFLILLFWSLSVNKYLFGIMLIMGGVYCYLLPFLAHKTMNAEVKVRLIDWLCLPIAIFIKSIGPNIYIWDKIMKKRIKYEKVER